jgi:membrane-associated protease RseP (regulator of RpoE activity)
MSDNPLSPLEYQFFDPERQEVRVVVIPPPKRRYWLHALLFLLTVLSTLCIGARLQYNFEHNLGLVPPDQPLFFPWVWALSDWRRLLMGVPFSACLLGILTAHEFGHYVLCVKRRVFATLPFFIPAPTLIGTFGAFIRIQSPIRSRTDLFDIGIAGPIAGFVVAVPVLFFALLASRPITAATGDSEVVLGLPLIFNVAHWALTALGSHASVTQISLDQINLHPTAVAAWVGMFATSLNLMPGGQLDGGHIVFGVNPRMHRPVTFITIAILLPLAWFFSAMWLLWAVVLRLTIGHPPVPQWPGLNMKRKLLAVFALLMMLLTFSYAPLPGTGIRDIVAEWRQSRGK